MYSTWENILVEGQWWGAKGEEKEKVETDSMNISVKVFFPSVVKMWTWLKSQGMEYVNRERLKIRDKGRLEEMGSRK